MANDFTGFMPEETGAEQVRVESFFKPNLQLLDKVLATRQTMYNTNLDTMAKAKAKVEEVNSLEGFDRDEWFKMQEDYDKEIGDIMSLYEGDLSKANAELYGFTTKVGKDFGIHGKATAINERALGYMANKKELDKRLAEKKITQGQYWRLQEELEKTAAIGIGTDAKAYKGWRKINPIDAVDFDEFANKFLQNKEADLHASGYKRSYDPAGFYIWTNENHDVITYDSLMHELGTAYKNAAEKTNQLVDDFDYNLYKNNIKITNETYVNKYTKEANDKKTIVEQLKVTPKTREEVIKQQELLNRLQGKEDKPTGVLSKNDVIAKQLIIDKYSKLASQYEAEADRISVMNNDQLRSYYYQDYIDGEIRRLADPYAGAKSRDRVTIQRDVQRDPMLEVEIHRRKKLIDESFERAEVVVNKSEGKQLSFSGKDNKTLMEAVSGLKANKKELQGKLNQMKEEYKKNPTPQLLNEITKTQRQLGTTTAQLSTISNAQLAADEGMKKAGMKSNSDLINNHIFSFTNNLNNPNLDENKKFNSNHYALVVNMDAAERTKLFGTDDLQEIQKKDIKEVNSKLYNHYNTGDLGVSWAKALDPNKMSKVTEWIGDNLYDDVYDIPYNSFLRAGMQSGIATVNPFESLRRNIENNSNLYVKKTNENIFTQQTLFQATDLEKGNTPLNYIRRSYSNSFAANPQGFKSFGNIESTKSLQNRTFTSKDSESKQLKTATVDLSKVKPEDINVAQIPIDGVMWMQVRLRDTNGNFVYEADGKTPATEWVVPADIEEWNSNVSRIALENINGLLRDIESGSAEYDKSKLSHLSYDERLEHLATKNKQYDNYLTQLAGVNYLTDWQILYNIDNMKKGDVIFMPTGDGRYNAIKRTENGQYGIYDANNITEDENGDLILMKGNPNQLHVPHVGTALGVLPKQNSMYFNSPIELAKAVQFTQSIKNK